ncbi:MAG: phosphopentomutase [Gammaproteobacteria bacterium]
MTNTLLKRAIIIVLDSFGIGFSDDADESDRGANTLAHIAKWRAENNQALAIPNLCALGLNEALKLSSGEHGQGLPLDVAINSAYGYAVETSAGKDTPSGHWEMAGVPVHEDWGYFVGDKNCFPQALIESFIKQAKLPGVLGCCHASGTTIIEQLGEEHIKTGKPIVYTSADSVFQIAAHEEAFGLERLYEISHMARKLVDEYRIGRVIARPFVGEPGSFTRTANRIDIATPPPAETLLDKCIQGNCEVVAIGKIADIFAHRGISKTIKVQNNDDTFNKTLDAMKNHPEKTLIFSNFNDFDTQYGHRRNIEGYANALEEFDKRLPELQSQLQPGDLVIISADHGCDPTWPGTDHTREHIPVLAFGPDISSKNIGRRETFADIGQTVSKHLGLSELKAGKAFL